MGSKKKTLARIGFFRSFGFGLSSCVVEAEGGGVEVDGGGVEVDGGGVDVDGEAVKAEGGGVEAERGAERSSVLRNRLASRIASASTISLKSVGAEASKSDPLKFIRTEKAANRMQRTYSTYNPFEVFIVM